MYSQVRSCFVFCLQHVNRRVFRSLCSDVMSSRWNVCSVSCLAPHCTLVTNCILLTAYVERWTDCRQWTFGFHNTHGFSWITNKLLATVCTEISRTSSHSAGCNEVMEIVRNVEQLTQLACRSGVCQDRRSHEKPAHNSRTTEHSSSTANYTSQQDFGTRKVYCVSNVPFHAESKYAIKIFPSPTVFVQWPF